MMRRFAVALILLPVILLADKPDKTEKINLRAGKKMADDLAEQLPPQPFIVTMNSNTLKAWQDERFIGPPASLPSQRVFVFEVDDTIGDHIVSVRLAKANKP